MKNKATRRLQAFTTKLIHEVGMKESQFEASCNSGRESGSSGVSHWVPPVHLRCRVFPCVHKAHPNICPNFLVPKPTSHTQKKEPRTLFLWALRPVSQQVLVCVVLLVWCELGVR